jgi:hypothetical protein
MIVSHRKSSISTVDVDDRVFEELVHYAHNDSQTPVGSPIRVLSPTYTGLFYIDFSFSRTNVLSCTLP